MDASTRPIETDAVIVGAGPVGLFQVFQLGLQELKAHVVDSLPYAGGQCVELYGDKPIYDIPGIKVCTGRELAQRLLEQIAPFDAGFHFGQEVATIAKQDDGRFLLGTSKGTQFLARAVVIAAGVGAFVPRKLKVEGASRFEGTQIVHRLSEDENFEGRHVVVAGDEDPALEAAIRLAGDGKAASVSLLHRRDQFRAEADTVAAMRALVASGKLRLVIAQPTGLEETAAKLTGLQVLDVAGTTRTLRCDTILALLGISPKLGPIADWGLALERKQVAVDTESFATNVPGIFAVGDINTYPGKKKLIACGFHECVLAAFAAAELVYGEKPHLQYTTTSTRLHDLLGVKPGSAS